MTTAGVPHPYKGKRKQAAVPWQVSRTPLRGVLEFRNRPQNDFNVRVECDVCGTRMACIDRLALRGLESWPCLRLGHKLTAQRL